MGEDRHGLLLAVADGPGHGEEAARAGKIAIGCVQNHKDRSFDLIFADVHEALHNTRGAALTLGRVRAADGVFVHAGIGNVAARLYPREDKALLPRPGILGRGAPRRARVTELPWRDDSTLLFHTDGVAFKWSAALIQALSDHHVMTISHYLMRHFRREADDATLVVARARA